MTTLEMEIAVMKYFGVRQNLIVPNVSWGMFLGNEGLHECDILSLTPSGYATEIEIKVSKHDLLKDGEKWHGHLHNHIANFFFAVPEKLKDIALEVIPERAGLFTVKRYESDYILRGTHQRMQDELFATQVRPCIRNKRAVKWTDEERAKLARLGTMRILSLKEKFFAELSNKQLSINYKL